MMGNNSNAKSSITSNETTSVVFVVVVNSAAALEKENRMNTSINNTSYALSTVFAKSERKLINLQKEFEL